MTNKTAYLVFTEGRHWLCRYFKKGFSHVYMLINDGYNWIIIDPKSRSLTVEILNVPSTTKIHKLIRNKNCNERVLKVSWFDTKQSYILKPINLVSCVSIIKYALGIPKFIMTPYGLYKFLIKTKLQKTKWQYKYNIEIIW